MNQQENVPIVGIVVKTSDSEVVDLGVVEEINANEGVVTQDEVKDKVKSESVALVVVEFSNKFNTVTGKDFKDESDSEDEALDVLGNFAESSRDVSEDEDGSKVVSLEIFEEGSSKVVAPRVDENLNVDFIEEEIISRSSVVLTFVGL